MFKSDSSPRSPLSETNPPNSLVLRVFYLLKVVPTVPNTESLYTTFNGHKEQFKKGTHSTFRCGADMVAILKNMGKRCQTVIEN